MNWYIPETFVTVEAQDTPNWLQSLLLDYVLYLDGQEPYFIIIGAFWLSITKGKNVMTFYSESSYESIWLGYLGIWILETYMHFAKISQNREFLDQYSALTV